MKSLLQGSYLLIIALWVGGVAAFTFVVTPRIFSHYDRDMAGKIVDVLFPVYFPYNLILSTLALLLLVVMWKAWAGHAHQVSIVLAFIAIIINFYVLFKLYPDILEIKRQVPSFIDMPPDVEPRASFRRLHAVSAVLNLSQFLISATLLFLGRAFPR